MDKMSKMSLCRSMQGLLCKDSPLLWLIGTVLPRLSRLATCSPSRLNSNDEIERVGMRIGDETFGSTAICLKRWFITSWTRHSPVIHPFQKIFFFDYSEDYHTFLLTKLCDRQSSITYCLVTIKSRWFSRFSLRIHWSILWNIDHCFQRSTFLRLICFISICNHWILRWRMFVQMWSNDHKDYWADFN